MPGEPDIRAQLEQSQREAAYYKGLAEDCGSRRLREAEALSNVIARLRQAEQALAASRDELELRVETRTAELREANTRLQQEISERLVAEAALRESEALRKRVFESSLIPFVVMDGSTYQLIDCNPAATALYGYSSREELLSTTPSDVSVPVQPDGADSATQARYYIEQALVAGAVVFEWRHRRPNGEIWDAQIHLMRFESGGRQLLQFTLQDITMRKQAEEQARRLEAQFRQAQKMESVGRLAGGVAHDFNNMLGVILGHTEMALEETAHGSPLHDDLLEIRKAAQRSADLTRQLLAFARKQTVQPKILDLNDTISSMLKMLQRLIGENIQLAWQPGPGLGPIKMDPSQIDQILANLVVNARDAIDKTGQVTIETSPVSFDDNYVQTHGDCIPGDYVMLAVSDSGKGMDKEIQSHLFEPFFTTKGVGKGTGLGLATVYGIVKQNGGIISVDSEPGRGATFKICFPRAAAAAASAAVAEDKRSMRGTETILLVEDEDQILNLSQRILQKHGYTVIAVRMPSEALQVVREHPAPIHLLLTDVVMPGMNGRELREQLSVFKPELRCLFMSGYTADVIAHHGVLEESLDFLQKPFSGKTLVAKVREVLDRIH